MCTVSFVPKYNNDFVLTSNRDEQLKRKNAFTPQIELIEGVNVLYPKDGEKGGTWIGVSDKNIMICLLNGAFDKHSSTPPYAKSRGIVVKDLLVSEEIEKELTDYNLSNIEPFTLVIVEYSDTLKLIEFRWDGQNKHTTLLNSNEVHIWSSCTLYSKSEADYKAKQFKTFILPNSFAQDIINFHEYGTKTEPLLMKYTANTLYDTVSITQVNKTNNLVEMKYKNLSTQETVSKTITSKACKKTEH